jgi:hypothetical protein
MLEPQFVSSANNHGVLADFRVAHDRTRFSLGHPAEEIPMRNRTAALALATLGAALVCGSCGTPPWQEPSSQPDRTSTAAVPAATPSTAKATPVPPPAPTTTAQNDLATGSAKRKLEAGGVRLSINYWSTLAMDEWTRTAAKPLNMSASAKFIDGSKQDIFLSKVTVNVEVQGATGPLKAPAPLVDETSLTPGYLIKSPSSYGQVFTISTLAPKATSVTLALTYELLAQTAPKAKTYAKQTASDTLTIPIQP